MRSLLFGLMLLVPHTVSSQAARPAALLDTAIARMGGPALLRGVERARFEMLTQWQRIAFDERPFGDQPSYESHTDLRDYTIAAWRNTRRFSIGPSAAGREIVDVVRDTVAIRRSLGGSGGVASPAVVTANTWSPLNIAYVQERLELFAMAPERLLLAARAAPDLRAQRDTTIAGAAHARVSATVDGIATTILLRRSTGFLTAASFRTAEPNDFGLVPWGEMDVEFWYSSWRRVPSGIVYPFQTDVRRVGRTYKRMTVLSASFNPPATPDSFAVSDSLRGAYLATARRPMHDVPLDSARMVEDRFASFGAPGSPSGAVKLGRSWIMLEGGQAPLSVDRAAGWLARTDPSARLAGAVVTMPAASGGISWLVAQRVPVHVAPGAVPFADAVLRGHGVRTPAGVRGVASGRWLRVDGDSLWLEPIDLPDAPGALIAYAPSLEWIYSGMAANPLYLDLVLARARERGWGVRHVGSARSIRTALPPAQILRAGR